MVLPCCVGSGASHSIEAILGLSITPKDAEAGTLTDVIINV